MSEEKTPVEVPEKFKALVEQSKCTGIIDADVTQLLATHRSFL